MSSGSSNVPSSSTSVTPRQRPKACQLNPVNQFTIGLPPSPSPRNILSSPIDAQNFKASKTPDNFNAQFEVDFNNIDNQTAPPAPQASQPSASVNPTVQKQETEKFDDLFKSSLYPDPFGDNDDEIVEIQTNYAGTQQTRMFESQQQQVTTKVNQVHRRYLSDTSGFKRFETFFCIEFRILLISFSAFNLMILGHRVTQHRAAT